MNEGLTLSEAIKAIDALIDAAKAVHLTGHPEAAEELLDRAIAIADAVEVADPLDPHIAHGGNAWAIREWFKGAITTN